MKFKVGDIVEITKTSYVGRLGNIVKVELASAYPIVVEVDVLDRYAFSNNELKLASPKDALKYKLTQ